ncbi:SDR family NAD(P)-dependent oxidoreductase [Acetobacterium carbinolicum]|jgi:Dehydrogenases with different specificities (related to short-chain alcohol dehydrogenases)|uniref:SDR family NAD(P)-dependent oxidoreductase n=1 Tax=Acetobacterium carbinolicum TaxID=52690 RepID=UPI0039C8C797
MAIYKEFKDKVALVTGGAGGIGKATVRKLGANGCKVFICDISDAIVNTTIEEIQSEGIDIDGVSVDIACEESVQAMVDACIKRYGKIDYLVTAAGIYKDKKLTEMTFNEWKQTIDINLNGVFLVTHLVLPQMLERKQGSIIVFGSQAGIRGSALHTHYAATKSAMQGFARSLIYEVAASGVRINCVAPGVIRTPMTMNGSPEKMVKWLESIPMRRFGEAEEVANVIAFLLSDDASYVVGQTIPINGGSVVNT